MRRISRSESHNSGTKLGRVAASTPGAHLLLGTLLLGLSLTCTAAFAQKPAPPPPPPPTATNLPQVGYMLTWMPSGITLKDINNFGDVAGTNHTTNIAYALNGLTPNANTVNLNTLGAAWYDLNTTTPNTLSTGWTASTAYAVNDFGDMVGTAIKVTATKPKRITVNRVFVLENAFNRHDRPRRFLLLPTRSNVDWAWDINNYGVVVAGEQDSDKGVIRYTPNYPPNNDLPYYVSELAIPGTGLSNVKINDWGVIVDRNGSNGSTRLIPGGVPEFFSGVEFLAISNNFISGLSYDPAGPIRMPSEGTPDIKIIFSPNAYRSWAVNDRGDTTFQASVNGSARGYLYTDAKDPKNFMYGYNGNGILPLDQLVVNPDAEWLNATDIRPRAINDDNVSGFGQIGGFAFDPAAVRSFVLTPVPLP